MMMVFSFLAEMVGGALGIVVMIFGNIFVIALEGLLVGVQGLRLEFYEMFNRFFEGAGREFCPLNQKEL
jgi:V/A-type H+-transporting ATPase subunit I